MLWGKRLAAELVGHPSAPAGDFLKRQVAVAAVSERGGSRADVSAASSSVSSDTPRQLVSSFDHLVTQWMSVVIVSDGSAGNFPHDRDTGSATAPWIVKLHSASGVCGVCGVGPADSTGRPLVTYWPGGTREGR